MQDHPSSPACRSHHRRAADEATEEPYPSARGVGRRRPAGSWRGAAAGRARRAPGQARRRRPRRLARPLQALRRLPRRCRVRPVLRLCRAGPFPVQGGCAPTRRRSDGRRRGRRPRRAPPPRQRLLQRTLRARGDGAGQRSPVRGRRRAVLSCGTPFPHPFLGKLSRRRRKTCPFVAVAAPMGLRGAPSGSRSAFGLATAGLSGAAGAAVAALALGERKAGTSRLQSGYLRTQACPHMGGRVFLEHVATSSSSASPPGSWRRTLRPCG